jgi:hypothetical protein
VSNHIARIRIGNQLLVRALNLPEGTLIEGIREIQKDSRVIPLAYEFRISNPDLPEVLWGDIIPLAIPQFQTDYDDNHILGIKLKDWGLNIKQWGFHE